MFVQFLRDSEVFLMYMKCLWDATVVLCCYACVWDVKDVSHVYDVFLYAVLMMLYCQ